MVIETIWFKNKKLLKKVKVQNLLSVKIIKYWLNKIMKIQIKCKKKINLWIFSEKSNSKKKLMKNLMKKY